MSKIFLLFLLWLIITNASAQSPTPALTITPLTGDFYIFTTYKTYNGTPFPANGMYVVTAQGVIMIDSPWDETQFQPLLDSIKARHHREVVLCIATHSHEDRTGGLEFYAAQGIKTYTTTQTDAISQKSGGKRATFLIGKDTVFTIGQYSFQTFYPGAGHTPDNIVIWFEKERILYGGCLVKSMDARDLGNLADADIAAWTPTIRNVQAHCKHPAYIIPGHQRWRSRKSLQHTLKLIKRH